MALVKHILARIEENTAYARIAFLFRILLGFTYLTVFISLIPQILNLIGSKGLLPIAELVKNTPQLTYLRFPTLHIWFSSDASLITLLLLGAVFAALLLYGFLPRLSLLACIAIYLSYVISGRDFFWFQWDNLLLEASFIALFLPLNGLLWKPKALRAPSVFAVFLFRWLAFRLYFESGIAKLLYGAGTWHNLSAMQYYYETSPLPSFGGWFAQQLLHNGVHAAIVIAVLFLELIVPLFIFWPRKLRIIAFYLLAAMNVIIGLTSNYGFFNFLSIAIGLFMLDDQHLLKFARLKRWLQEVSVKKASRFAVAASFALLLFVLPFSIIEFIPFANHNFSLSGRVAQAHDYYSPYRVISIYHLFPGVVQKRIVIEILGSTDGNDWKPFRLKHTPGDPAIMPPWLPLYQSRFAFQYSFVTLGSINVEYFTQLITKLCSSQQDIAGLLRENPFPSKPAFIKLDLYRYNFSTPKQLLSEGIWWNRELIGNSEVIPCAKV